eukprot:1010112-Pyramimonas_sp.AAC.1
MGRGATALTFLIDGRSPQAIIGPARWTGAHAKAHELPSKLDPGRRLFIEEWGPRERSGLRRLGRM